MNLDPWSSLLPPPPPSKRCELRQIDFVDETRKASELFIMLINPVSTQHNHRRTSPFRTTLWTVLCNGRLATRYQAALRLLVVVCRRFCG